MIRSLSPLVFMQRGRGIGKGASLWGFGEDRTFKEIGVREAKWI